MKNKEIDIASMRRNYSLSALTKEDVLANPIAQFHTWFEEAHQSEVLEPNAMTLATVNAKNEPCVRVVLLKDCLDDGFVFYTNYNSDKGKEIEGNANGALSFLWLELQRQIRIEGILRKFSHQEAVEYFQSRPRESQIGAWASNQSEVIPDRTVLNQKYTAIEEQYKDYEVLPKPEYWGNYILEPKRMEFWQGRMSRLHDRIRYRKDAQEHWIIERLSP